MNALYASEIKFSDCNFQKMTRKKRLAKNDEKKW